MRSRVMPGSSVTIERRVPVRRLKSVDLPTLGRPTITMEGSLPVIVFALLLISLFDWLFDLLFIGERRALRNPLPYHVGGDYGGSCTADSNLLFDNHDDATLRVRIDCYTF